MIAILVNTKEKAEAMAKLLLEAGARNPLGKENMDYHDISIWKWDSYKEETCMDLDNLEVQLNCYCERIYYKNHGYTIIDPALF